MNPIVIPEIDSIPLPAPVWLLRFLSYLTFVLHLIPMNLVFAGGLLAAVLAAIGRRQERTDYLRLAGQIAGVLPPAAAAAITTGVAALLFQQVLYGPLYYTATVLMAVPWISVIGLLILGYYGYYAFALHRRPDGHPRAWLGAIAAAMFLAVGFIYANGNTLMIQPEKFWPIFARRLHGLWLNSADPILWPRYLHFVGGGFAVTGLATMIIGLVARRRDERYGAWAVRFGGMVFVAATIVQVLLGIWQLLSIRRPAMMLFMGRSALGTAVFVAALILTLVAIVAILVAALGKMPVVMTIAGSAATLVIIVCMAIMRGLVRGAYLAGVYEVYAQRVRAQWGIIGIFAVLLVAGLAVTGWMVYAVVTKKGLAAREVRPVPPRAAAKQA